MTGLPARDSGPARQETIGARELDRHSLARCPHALGARWGDGAVHCRSCLDDAEVRGLVVDLRHGETAAVLYPDDLGGVCVGCGAQVALTWEGMAGLAEAAARIANEAEAAG